MSTNTSPSAPATPDPDLAAMLAAVEAAWAGSMMPPDLRQACLDFVCGTDTLDGILLLTLGIWIVDLAAAGHDRRMLEQVAAASAQRCIAMLMRAAKERDGAEFVPARQAIVAFEMARNVAAAEPFRVDIDGAVALYRERAGNWADDLAQMAAAEQTDDSEAAEVAVGTTGAGRKRRRA